ncbi:MULTISPECIES: LytR/AlgR family response regulator transcription factor [Brevibacillus]|jgi:two-component system response regulator LytT|uniref:Two-component response regulator n=1 Tax=Brevibacillus borstelensis AK1 TaxID=1300222 RepID=M8EEE6_9BACL|nr:LytTR family DNA-binding domain-containing protein [Brevibacillus borstelensis]EMT53860.1 two-component response regulator [Brevibacillus borstelensis AK1]KKX56740.1 histidine kinase [Brevibacillus borstelensis cifa_chp40]MBE5395571.1 response regulator transcription factor [Brevibacillus borstelensis]MCC0565627.1 LytTR family DNA-binding domain-containing protein [Brevibacillus borstelensis]MCM3470894.1 LytTR family DNA-binding domain-containing protein [Brevibacillus borstelensis]
MQIRIMIAEDERLAREELVYLLEQEADVEVLPCATNGRELLQLVEEYEPDVVFLDIKMPELEGDQAARMLAARKKRPLLVFSTAHEDYAVEAFKLNAVDYLLKPTEPQRLKETLQRLRKRLSETAPPSALPNPSKVAKMIIEDNNRLVVIDPSTVMYAVRDERVVQIWTESEVYTTRMTLQQLEEKLQAYPFFRTHKSYLVNLQYVSELQPWFNGAYNLILKGPNPVRLPVSRTAAKDLLKRLEG